jgi:hypothetical protein
MDYVAAETFSTASAHWRETPVFSLMALATRGRLAIGANYREFSAW